MAKRKLDLAAPTPGSQPKPAGRQSTPKTSALPPKSAASSKPVMPPEPTAALPEPSLELEDFADEPQPRHRRFRLAGKTLAAVVGLLVLYGASFELTHFGRIYPGVMADGVDVGGLSQADAARRLTGRAATFSGQVVTITQGHTNLRIPVGGLDPTYDSQRAAELAFQYGRAGSFTQRATAQARAAFGRSTVVSAMKFDTNRLVPYLTQLLDDTVTPVQNATLAFNNNQAEVTPAASGTRLDLGLLAQAVASRLAATSTDPIPAPIYQLAPTLGTVPLQAAVGQINSYVASPITLQSSGTERQIDQSTIISWINVGSNTQQPFLASRKLEDLYPVPPAANLGLNQAAVAAYVAHLASGIDQTAQNAGLAMQNDTLTVVQPSRTGIKLDQAGAVSGITAALKSTSQRTVALKLQTTQAEVNESNLDSLGIKEQISEGETYFPGSPSTRLINVRAGASKFNGVLLKPGETFSFGKLLGEVDASTGYVPELVILGDHEEKQYGGGLCQVSSTAFRAALAAGLPITERVNHAFAISYYTWPYSAPGVDATIYYPAVDFKFVNDTGHYLLMQTVMQGYDLKFDFFGTKTKSGVIRGPQFVSGSNDATQPSHTVFYRDVLDLSGNVIKTDTFNTYYKSSKDFPITKQFN